MSLSGTQQMEQAILQGALQGSAAVGEKRNNTESAGSQMSRHRLNVLSSSARMTHARNISKMSYRKFKIHHDTISGKCELDSHADTCVAGMNCVVLEETNQRVNVSAFTDAYKTFNDVTIVTAATAYDDNRTGTIYILVLGQAIYMADNMDNSLICPNQLRKHGIIVNDCPKHLAPPNNPSSHSIICNNEGEDLHINLSLKGVTSYFTTRIPMIQEIETCKWIYLTNENDWDPHSEEFQVREQLHNDIQDFDRNHENRNIYCVQTSCHDPLFTEFTEISHAFDDHYILTCLQPGHLPNILVLPQNR